MIGDRVELTNLLTTDDLQALDSRMALDLSIGAAASAENAARRGERKSAELRMNLAMVWMDIHDRMLANELRASSAIGIQPDPVD